MKKHIIIISMLLISMSSFLFGQKSDKGLITGRIFNEKNNEPVPFATVNIWETNIVSLSDLDGKFIFTGVKPGFIQIKITSVGYEEYISEPMQVTNSKAGYFEIPLKESSILLNEVVVKTSQFRRTVESPVSLRRIDIEQIEKNPGGNRDISKVITSFPGVGSGVSFRNDVIVRGGGSSENRFYLDDIEIPNLNHFATQGASGGPVGIINVDFIREVNFYSGAFPASKGNALSSVLDFKQIDGNKEKLKYKATVGASDIGLTVDGPLSEKTTFIASARRSYLQFLFSAIGLPFLPTYNDFQFKTRTKFDEHNELTIIGIGAIDQFELNTEANETEEQRYILQYLPVNEQWNYTLGAVFKHFRENSYDSWIVSRNMLYNTQYKYIANNDTNPKLLDYNSFEAENKFRYENNRQTDNGYKINVGLATEYARYYNSTFRQTFTGIPLVYESNMDFIKWGTFGQVSKGYLSNKLNLSLGLRADANNYDAEMSNLFKQLSPRASASYELSPKWFVNYNIGRYFQLPSYTTLGYRNNAGDLINKTNNLKYIQVDHNVLGFDFMANKESKISLEGFFKNYNKYPFSISDSIALASKGADFGTFGDEEVKSIGKGRAYGAEFLYQNKDLFGANVTLSYTFVRSEFENFFNKYIPSAWDNRHLLNILIRKSFKGNWDFGTKWRFVGGSPYTPDDLIKSANATAWDAQGRTYLDYSRFNSLRLKAFHQLDIRVDKSFFFDNSTLVFYMDIQNLYNFKADAPPTYLRASNPDGTLKPATGNPPVYELKQLERTGGGTVLPTIGVIIEF